MSILPEGSGLTGRGKQLLRGHRWYRVKKNVLNFSVVSQDGDETSWSKIIFLTSRSGSFDSRIDVGDDHREVW